MENEIRSGFADILTSDLKHWTYKHDKVIDYPKRIDLTYGQGQQR